MKTLYLPLNAKWYEMIESGEKKEEYREIKQYYCSRLGDDCPLHYYESRYSTPYGVAGGGSIPYCSLTLLPCVCKNIHDYNAVRFSYGYTKRTMTFEIESISIGKGNPEWGAPEEDVFIIKLGERIL